jgi:DNA polymerase IV
VSERSDGWSRIIVHADMDAFYAAIEQLDDPRLRGRPLLVGSASARGVVLTASYEARSSGAGSAMPMQRARRLCPEALVVPPRFERYQEISEIVMATLAEFSPLVEPLSLDEAFLDMTGSTRLFGDATSIGMRIKTAIRANTGGLTASVGISSIRYVAKVASGFRKPDGLTIVPPDAIRDWLAPQSVGNLWGAGPKTTERLRSLGFETIGQVATADPARLERSLGALGRRFFSLANGVDARDVVNARQAQSVGSERTLNVDVTARADIEAHLRLAADNVAQRLRRSRRRARGVRVKLKTTQFRLLTRQSMLSEPTDVAAVLFSRATKLLDDFDDAGPFRLVGLAVYDFDKDNAEPNAGQLDWLPAAGNRARRLETAIDALVSRFGSGVVQRAGDLGRDRGVGVAANLDFLHEREGKED